MTAELYKEKDKTGRTHLQSRFMRESLVDKDVVSSAVVEQEISILPDMNLVSLGGKSIIDRGKKAVYPFIDELVENNKKHQIILGITGGVRVRHTLAIGMDFGLPIGGLATIIGAVEEQNATLIYSLLAKHGGVRVPKDHFVDFPNYLAHKMIPIVTGLPPYHYWEKNPQKGVLPDHGSDFGLYMVAEVLGARSMIFVKDQEGLYTEDPAKNKDAKFIPKISAQELLKRDPDPKNLILDYPVIQMIAKARHAKKVYVINGLKPGNLTKALAGEHVGTIIYKEE